MMSSNTHVGDSSDHLVAIMSSTPVSGVELRAESFTSSAARRLLALADAYNTRLYGHADASPLEPEEFEPARGGLFLVAYRDGELVACGGLRTAHPPAPSGAGEVKRMYVVEVARRQGLGQVVLTALEELRKVVRQSFAVTAYQPLNPAGWREAAQRFGYSQVVLDTGRKQAAAHALYEARGYHRIPGFTIYRDSPGNRAYAKLLSPEGVG